MASLTTTISFQTTTLFPTPLNITIPATETVNLDAALNTVTVAAGGTAIVYGPTGGAVGTSLVTYVYIQSDSTNNAINDVLINYTDSTGPTQIILAKLLPGDFLYIPICADGAGVEVEIDNTASSVPKTFYYMHAERG